MAALFLLVFANLIQSRSEQILYFYPDVTFSNTIVIIYCSAGKRSEKVGTLEQEPDECSFIVAFNPEDC